jgi:DeoR family fructose operon transcriptional repressor
MLPFKRLEKIMELLQREQSVKVSELGALFQVSEKTIREDLEKLEEKGLLSRIHGGAVLNSDKAGLASPAVLNSEALKEKEMIARYAVKYIEANDVIALDGGSTTLEIAKLLGRDPVTVITNDVFIISELVRKDNVRLVVPGGYRHNNLLVSDHAADFIRKLNIQKSFISTTGIHLDYGLTVFTSELLDLKNALVQCAKTVICVADHGKFEKCALMTFARLSEIDTIVTDEGLPLDIADRYRKNGVTLQTAGADL